MHNIRTKGAMRRLGLIILAGLVAMTLSGCSPETWSSLLFNLAPVARFTCDRYDVPMTPWEVNFDASESYDPDNDGIGTYTWQVGNLERGWLDWTTTEPHTSYTFIEPGEYTVILVVCDRIGYCDDAQRTIYVH
jgi:PKD repeat protein